MKTLRQAHEHRKSVYDRGRRDTTPELTDFLLGKVAASGFIERPVPEFSDRGNKEVILNDHVCAREAQEW